MGKRVVIAGAGGFGRGVFGWLDSSQRHRAQHDISEIVFIDDVEPVITPPAPRIGTIATYNPQPNDLLLCAIGDPRVRQTVVRSLGERGAVFHTYVDDRVIIGSRVKVMTGAIVCPGTVVSADAVIREHVHINFNCSIGHDVDLGRFTTLSPSVNIMGEVRVGEACFFGGSAVVLPRLTIASWSLAGAGAVVVRATNEGAVVVGNPAKHINTKETARC